MVYQKNSRQDALIKRKGTFIDESEQIVVSSIQMFGANIEHSSRNNYRPYLMMYGEISAVAFPNGQYQGFIPKTQVHIRYEFSDDEIAQLATKGLFYDGFKCPDIISENAGVEIPMRAIAKRYELMGNTYVTLDLPTSEIYETNTEQCGYIFADYFESQIPSKLDTKAIEEEKDMIPSFDAEFAAQFESDMEDAQEKQDEAALENAFKDFEDTKTEITSEAKKLLEKSTVAKTQHEIAEAMRNGKNIHDVEPFVETPQEDTFKEPEPEVVTETIPETTEEDEFATFQKVQESQAKMRSSQDQSETSDAFDVDEESMTDVEDKEEEKEKEDEFSETLERASKTEASVNITVGDDENLEKDSEDSEPYYGDVFSNDKEISKLFDPNDDTDTKQKIEESMRTTVSTKQPNKVIAPNNDRSASDDFSFGE